MATSTLDFSTPHVLRNAREYNAAVAEVEQLLDAKPKKGTPDYDRLEFLSVLMEAYEAKHVKPLRDPTPQEVVDFMLEQKGMTRTDLAPLMGGASRVSDFFNGKRDLSKDQIKMLRERLGIPADLLLA